MVRTAVASLARDLTPTLRGLSRRPGYALTVVTTLALGIGLNAAAFGVVDGLLLEPLPVREPDRLVRVYRQSPEAALTYGPVRWADFDALRDEATSLVDAASYVYTALALEREREARLVAGELVSANYFTLLGVSASRGRVFADALAREPVVVLSHRAWRRWFGEDDDGVLGATLLVNGHAHTVIGVAPQGFGGLTRGLSPELWIPMESIQWELRATPWVVARLEPGLSLGVARAELALIGRRTDRAEGEPNPASELVAFSADRVRLLPQLDGALADASLLLMAMVGIVLALAAVNVSHITLARGLGRQGELATRVSLGASRGALFRLLLAESLVLSLCGGAVSIGLAAALFSALETVEVPLPVDVSLAPSLDYGVLGFTLVVSLLVAAGVAVAPARLAGRLDLIGALHGGPGVAGGGSGGRSGRALVPVQVALSLVLLASAGLCLRSLRNAETLSPGFDAEDVVVATVAPQLQGYRGPALDRLYDDLLSRVRARPDVRAAGFASHLPLSVEWQEHRVAVGSRRDDAWLAVGTAGVGPGYFESLRIPLRRGRLFAESDEPGTRGVAVVNETLAATLWPGGDALGRAIRLREQAGELEVVGVVADGRYRTLGEPRRGFLYRPLGQGGPNGPDSFISSGSRTLVVRTSSAPQPFAVALREILHGLDPGLAVMRLGPLEDALGIALWLPRLAASAFGLFGLLALALAATGIYGVLSYSAGRRRREMGLRLALGARPRDVRQLVLREALWQTAVGVSLGLGLSWAATRLLALALYGVSATDAATLSVASAILLAVGWAAAQAPAMRASRTPIAESLRGE